MTIYRWLRDGFIVGEQPVVGAPWRIRIDETLRAKSSAPCPAAGSIPTKPPPPSALPSKPLSAASAESRSRPCTSTEAAAQASQSTSASLKACPNPGNDALSDHHLTNSPIHMFVCVAQMPLAESWFLTYRVEMVDRRVWANLAKLRTATFDYIEVFYNRRRRHSALGQLSPAHYGLNYKHLANQAA